MILYVQLAIHGELAVVTVPAQIPGARQFHFAQRAENASRAQFAVVRLTATGARDGALIGGRLGELQQLAEGGCAGLMQGGAEGHFHRLQIQSSRLLAFGEDAAEQRGYFVLDLGLDRRRRFFSSGVSVSSTGRAWQIFSFTSNRSPLSWRKR